MIDLNIVTRCTRTSYLDLIEKQIFTLDKFNFNVIWWILFDLSIIKFDPDVLVGFSKKNINLKFFYGVPGDMGHTYLNQIYSQINGGYIYNLDDDNNLHPNFYIELDSLLKEKYSPIIVFDQYVGGKDFSGLEIRQALPENMKVSKVDFAQIIFDKSFTEQVKLIPNNYCADGFFIEELYNKYSDKFLFANQTLSYYNYFTNLC